MSRFPRTVEELVRAIGGSIDTVDSNDRTKVLCQSWKFSHHNGYDRDTWDFTKQQFVTLTRLAALVPHAPVESDLYTIFLKRGWWTLEKDGRLSRKISRKEYLDLEQCH